MELQLCVGLAHFLQAIAKLCCFLFTASQPQTIRRWSKYSLIFSVYPSQLTHQINETYSYRISFGSVSHFLAYIPVNKISIRYIRCFCTEKDLRRHFASYSPKKWQKNVKMKPYDGCLRHHVRLKINLRKCKNKNHPKI